MRLIDADEIKYILARDLKEKMTGLYVSREYINQMPTIDHVKHGHWIIHPSGEFGTCDACWKQEDFPECKGELGRYYKVFPFCPNCGADMR